MAEHIFAREWLCPVGHADPLGQGDRDRRALFRRIAGKDLIGEEMVDGTGEGLKWPLAWCTGGEELDAVDGSIALHEGAMDGETRGARGTELNDRRPVDGPRSTATFPCMPPRTIELDASLPESDPTLDRALRPTSLEEYVGQTNVVGSLRAMLAGSTGRGEPVEHLLFYGPPGLGKTSLAGIIAASAGTRLRAASGPSLERAGDLVAILTNLERGDVLFLDEIHRLGAAVQEILYGAMEDFRIDLVVGTGPEASTLSLPVAPFTLIGATTDVDRVAGPLRDRFGAIFRLDWYSDEEIASILVRSAGKLDLPIDDAAVDYLAARSRGVPRIANRLLRRLRDEVALEGVTVATVAIAERAMGRLGIDARGLDDSDRRVLTTLAERYAGGPVGLAPLAAITGDPVSTIEGVIEPYLVRIGFLDRTPRGRVLTESGRAHLVR